MKSGTIRKVPLAVLTAAVLGIAAPMTAGAATLTPGYFYLFGEQTVGTTSASVPFTLTVKCWQYDPLNYTGDCLSPDTVTRAAISTTGDFAQTNDCPATLTSATLNLAVSCTINVTFTPTAAGRRDGSLTAGSGLLTTWLSGTGVSPPTTTTTTAPTTTTTTTTTTTFNLKAAIKKCKKKFPKGPKRKRCIKKAKARAAAE